MTNGSRANAPALDLNFLTKGASLSGAFPHGFVPEIVFFEEADFQGEQWRTNLPHSNVGSHKISSFIVVAGEWDLFSDPAYGGNRVPSMLAGYYRTLPQPLTQIRSFKLTQFP
jgi:hypothetical protein